MATLKMLRTCSVFILFVCGALASGEIAASEEVKLAGADFTAKIAGNTVVGDTVSGVMFQVYYAKNGTMKGYSEKGDWSGSDEGKWEAESDKICYQWSNWRQGKRFCRKVSSKGDTIFFYLLDDDLNSTGEIESGNSRGL